MKRGKEGSRASPGLLHGLSWSELVHVIADVISVICIPASVGDRKENLLLFRQFQLRDLA